MRRNVPSHLALVGALAVAAASCVFAQDAREPAGRGPAPAPQPAAERPALINSEKLEELLAHWERNSANLKTLDVEMTRTDRSPAWGDDDHYEGRAMFKSPNRAFLDFKKEKEVVDPKTGKKAKAFQPHERIVCTGTEVWQYRCDNAQIFIYPLERDAQQRALEEGPLPFLFNFKAADAKRRYEMALVAEDANSSTIRILPRLPIDQESFKLAFVTLDRQLYLLPRRIILFAPDGKSSKDFVLKLRKQAANCVVMDANFVPKETPGWKVIRNPGGDGKPAPRPAQPAAAGAGAGADAPPVQQPAMRSRLFGGRRN